MKHFPLLFLIPLFILSCNNNQEANSTGQATAEPAKSGQEAPAKLPEESPGPIETPGTGTSSSQPTLIPELGEVKVNPETGIPSSEIYLSSPDSENKIFLVKDMGFQDMEDKSNWEAYSIPANADWAFNSWFAGGGNYYYGMQEGRKIDVFRAYIDEGTDSSNDLPYELFRTIDLDHPQGRPSHYICYTEDNGASRDLMIAFSEDGNAIFAQYMGQTGKLHLQLDEKSMTTGGAHPVVVDRYIELVDGKENGTYTLSHSGVWDYAEYLSGKGKIFKFTINHDVSIAGDGYRDTPCF